MQIALRLGFVGVVLLAVGSTLPRTARILQPQSWRADIQIRVLEVTKTKTNISARVVIYTENDAALPLDGLPRRFGVFAYSATPDPTPGNNYAERTIP
jgi:hypothetical protein